MTTFFDLSSLGLATQQGQALQTLLNALQTAFPGYNPSTASPEWIVGQVFASWAADNGSQTAAGSTEMFRQYGTKLLNLAFQQGTPASAVATVTATDTLGHTLPAGTQVTLTLNSAPLAFQTTTAMTIANGLSSGTVTVVAVQNGTAFNGATNPCQAVSQINWLSSISVAAAASGGADQETDDHYLTRLVTTLQLQAPRPITASDYAGMALNFTPITGTDEQLVGRAVAIDGYDANPGSPTFNTFGNQRMVAVCVADASGNALNNDTMYGIGGSISAPITNPAQWGVMGWLESLREANFVVNVVAPNYTTVYVACTVKGSSGFTTATVQANVQAALLNYLTPQNFALPQGANVGWLNQTTVFRSKMVAIIQNTQGVDHVVSLAFDTNSNPTNTTNDLPLAGAFPLPISSVSSVPLGSITVQ